MELTKAVNTVETLVVDTDKASRYLGCSSSTLRSWKRQGKGPAWFRAGKLVRYRVIDLEQWISNHRVETCN
jgi:excisionase family DNA binding protein